MIVMARHLTCHMKVSGNCSSDCDLLELFLLGKKFTLFRRNLTSRIDRLGIGFILDKNKALLFK